MPNVSFKQCSRKENCVQFGQCGWLPATTEYFHRDKRATLGLSSPCRECHKQDSHNSYLQHKDTHISTVYKWRSEHPEAAKAIQDRYKEAHPDRVLQTRRDSMKRWRTTHPAEAKERHRKWHIAHPEQSREQSKRWRKANPERAREINRRSEVKNRDRINARGRIYAATHPEQYRTACRRRRARKSQLPFSFTQNDWERALEWWNGCCAYCGNPVSMFDRDKVLHQDHYVPLSSVNCEGTTPTNILPACPTCNRQKNDSDPVNWSNRKFGKRKANKILERIQTYFLSIRHV